MTGSEPEDLGTDDPVRSPESDTLLADVMLGSLAVYLRMCGYDAAYAGDRGVEADDRLLEIADAEGRVLLTRDVELAHRAPDAVCLSGHEVADQLAELRDAGFELAVAEEPRRCGQCNGRLESLDADARTPTYAPDPATTACWGCADCGQVFWRGSHHERVAGVIADL